MNNIKVVINDQVTLNYIKQSKFKKDYFAVLFSQNLNDIYASYNAVLFNVLLGGSKKLPNIRAINDRLNDMYGADLSAVNAKRGDVQEFGVVLGILNQKYTLENSDMIAMGCDTLNEIIYNPLVEDAGFKQSVFEIEKNNQIDEIKADINNKVSYAKKRCVSLMCSDEIFGINVDGDVSVLEKMDRFKLYEHYKRTINSLPINIYYIGNTDVNTVEKMIREKFRLSDKKTTAFFNTPIIKDVKEVKQITELTQAAQGKLSLGFRTGIVRKDEDYAALCMTNAIYGLTPTSKLFVNVREKLSLCYYCRSDLFAFRGIMLVSSGVEVENKLKAQDEILAQLDKVKNGDFTDQEIELARKYYINGLRSGFDSATAMLNWAAAENLDNTDNSQEDFIKKLSLVTRQQIIDAANKIELDTIYFLKGTDGKENE